jgi:hypothetical protein
MDKQPPITITAELTPAEAMAYAQFLKRVGWRDYRTNAVNDDEAYEMVNAGEKIRAALADAGYAPR